jgi:hypothetical protein
MVKVLNALTSLALTVPITTFYSINLFAGTYDQVTAFAKFDEKIYCDLINAKYIEQFDYDLSESLILELYINDVQVRVILNKY